MFTNDPVSSTMFSILINGTKIILSPKAKTLGDLVDDILYLSPVINHQILPMLPKNTSYIHLILSTLLSLFLFRF